MTLRLLYQCSPALKKLVAMVGSSFKIYKGIADLCTAKYRDSEGLYVGLKETAFCSLRSQLLMALHDSGANELCGKVAFKPCPQSWTPAQEPCRFVLVPLHIV